MTQGNTTVKIAAETARVRAVLTDTLTDTCSTQRLTNSPNSAGGQSESWATNLSNEPCAIVWTGGAHEDEATSRVRAVGDYLMSCLTGKDIIEKDRVVAQSVTYQVIYIQAPLSIEALKTIELSLIKP